MTDRPILREAKIVDLPEITRIRVAVHENHMSVSELAERGITHITTGARMLTGELGAWVATIDKRIVAFAYADKTNGNVWALFTDPRHEGKGCGSLLLNTCEKWLKENGRTFAVLDTGRNTKAVEFYAKRGWIEYQGDEDEVYMRKTL